MGSRQNLLFSAQVSDCSEINSVGNIIQKEEKKICHNKVFPSSDVYHAKSAPQ
jgi:hypothetical protein